MMTREEAKKKICPMREFTANYMYDKSYLECPDEISEASRCLAENCPKWRDGDEKVDLPEGGVFRYCESHCQDFKANYGKDSSADNILNFKVARCNKCPHRYGYCGG